MTGAINQMQMTYNPEEDRVLLCVNTTCKKEFRIWLTRRYILLLLKILKDHLERDPDVSSQSSPEAKEAVRTYKQEQALSGADFTNKFETQAEDYPLGEKGIVAFKLSFAFKGANMNLSIEPKEGQGIDFVINPELNTSLTQLILSAATQADWQIKPILENDAVNTGEKRVVN